MGKEISAFLPERRLPISTTSLVWLNAKDNSDGFLSHYLSSGTFGQVSSLTECAKYVNSALQPVEKPGTNNASSQASLSDFRPDFPAPEPGDQMDYKEALMKKMPKKKRNVTELYFNGYDSTAEIYTYNTKRKKRLTACNATYPGLFRLTKDDERDGMQFEIDCTGFGFA